MGLISSSCFVNDFYAYRYAFLYALLPEITTRRVDDSNSLPHSLPLLTVYTTLYSQVSISLSLFCRLERMKSSYLCDLTPFCNGNISCK